MVTEPDLTGQLDKMRRDWDQRARENARFYVATGRQDWTDADFFESGRRTVTEEILTDMINICQGKEPKQMTVLEIGCGAGRVTRALAGIFGEIYAVDISGEMVRHVHVLQNNGKDLSVLGSRRFDFAFSSIVFQHIPHRRVIESYVRDVYRHLRRGRLFKFQVQGALDVQASAEDSWLGVALSEAGARAVATRCGFEMRYTYGAGTQYFWLWFFKPRFAPQAWGLRAAYWARRLCDQYRRGRRFLARTAGVTPTKTD
jgi:SAM-dependent methyltransferase